MNLIFMEHNIVNTWKNLPHISLIAWNASIYRDIYVHRHGKTTPEFPCFEYIFLFDVNYLKPLRKSSQNQDLVQDQS
jgi:hypothetical protein